MSAIVKDCLHTKAYIPVTYILWSAESYTKSLFSSSVAIRVVSLVCDSFTSSFNVFGKTESVCGLVFKWGVLFRSLLVLKLHWTHPLVTIVPGSEVFSSLFLSQM